MDGRNACNAGAIAGIDPWMDGMPAMQEQLLIHGWTSHIPVGGPLVLLAPANTSHIPVGRSAGAPGNQRTLPTSLWVGPLVLLAPANTSHIPVGRSAGAPGT